MARSPNEADFAHQRALMVDRHVAARGVSDPRVLQAMREVPRHLFVSPVVATKAYGPGALPIGANQTISQPYMVALMAEALEQAKKGRMYILGLMEQTLAEAREAARSR